MNQYGIVEISLIKNELPYRALLPLGTPWVDAKDALLEMAANIEEHIRAAEATEKAAKENADNEVKE